MLVNALFLCAWGQPTGVGISRILPHEPARDLKHCTVFLLWFQRAGKLLLSATWATNYTSKLSKHISPHSFTAPQFFQAEKSQQHKPIELMTPFQQSLHFCPSLWQLQHLSDPALRQFPCAKLSEKYLDKKSKQLPAELAQTKVAQHGMRQAQSQCRRGAAGWTGAQQPLQWLLPTSEDLGSIMLWVLKNKERMGRNQKEHSTTKKKTSDSKSVTSTKTLHWLISYGYKFFCSCFSRIPPAPHISPES